MKNVEKILKDYLNSEYVDLLMGMLDKYNLLELDNDIPFDEIANRINALDSFGAMVTIADLKIYKLNLQPDDGRTHYLRMGVLPEDKSFNHIMKDYEDGISVFALDDAGLPIIDNIQLIADLTSRFYQVATIVTGDLVGTGFDGEPLITNVKTIGKADIDTTAIAAKVMDANFSSKIAYGEMQKNLGVYYDREIDAHYFTLNGFEYRFPVDGFDVRMGKDRLYD